MKTAFLGVCCFLAMLAIGPAAGAVEPKVADALQPVRLTQAELSGEIGRRIHDLIYNNYMALNLDGDFVEPFRTRPPCDGMRYIGAGKVVDAGSMFAAYTGDAKVKERTARLIDDLMKTRDKDGYFGHMKAQPGAKQNYINWILHDQEYTILGLTDNWRYCGDKKSLDCARQVADYVLKTFPQTPNPDKICTAGLPEAMLALYAATGDGRYLDFAANARHGNPHGEVECSGLMDWSKGDRLDDKTLLKTDTAHVYVNLARCYAQTMLYRWKPEPKLLAISHFIYGELVRKGGCLFVIGSASDWEHFSYNQNGVGPTSEACVTAYLIRWLNSLMRLDGDLRYGDIIERSIFNALFAAQSPSGRQIRYFIPFAGPREYFNQDGFCCPGNFRRIVAELPEMVYYRTQDGGVAVNLFTPSKTSIELGNGRSATIQQQTDYPNSGLVKIVVTPSEAAEFPLRLRIPRWCPAAKLAINGEPARDVSPGEKFYEIRRTWNPGDTITLDLPMSWRLVRGSKLQEGHVALLRGPVVYCVGTAQNTDLVKKYKEPRELMIDPASLGEPVADTSVRPGGLKVLAKAWPPGKAAEAPATLDVVLTEFVDPSGIATYFRVPDSAKTVDDELLRQK